MPDENPTPIANRPAAAPQRATGVASAAVRPSAPRPPDRNSVTTIRTDGSRVFLFPADTQGRFTRAREISAWALIAFYRTPVSAPLSNDGRGLAVLGI